MYKLGIVGLGAIFEYQKKALAEGSGFCVSGLCDPKIETLQGALSGMEQIPRYKDHKELLAGDCNGVLISVPLPAHYQVAMDAIQSKKNVLLEKPAVLSTARLEALYAAAREQGVVFHVAYHASFAGDLWWFLEQKEELIQSYGKIVGLSQSFFDPYMVPQLMQDKVSSLGDSWIDSGINALSVAERILPLKDATVKRAVCTKTQGVVTKMEAELQAADAVVKIHTDWSLGKNFKQTEILFENGVVVRLNHSEQSATLLEKGKETPLCNLAQRERLVEHYLGVFGDFLQALNQGNGNEEFTKTVHRLLFDVAHIYKEKEE